MITRIVTHAGVFHADEVLAIATLIKLGVITLNTPIERVNTVTPEMMQDNSCLVLDIGGSYNGVNHYDHHQDSELPATNVLVLGAFCPDAKLIAALLPFYDAVSDTDKGVTKSAPASFTQLVSNFNMLPYPDKFVRALQFAMTALDAVWAVAEESVRLESKWGELETVFNGCAKVQEDTEFIPNWKALAEQDGVAMLIAPNARAGWQIVSRDSDYLSIPKGADGQTFCHNTGFMAVYETREQAMAHAEYLASTL